MTKESYGLFNQKRGNCSRRSFPARRYQFPCEKTETTRMIGLARQDTDDELRRTQRQPRSENHHPWNLKEYRFVQASLFVEMQHNAASLYNSNANDM